MAASHEKRMSPRSTRASVAGRVSSSIRPHSRPMPSEWPGAAPEAEALFASGVGGEVRRSEQVTAEPDADLGIRAPRERYRALPNGVVRVDDGAVVDRLALVAK